jgi:hypothetical protein
VPCETSNMNRGIEASLVKACLNSVDKARSSLAAASSGNVAESALVTEDNVKEIFTIETFEKLSS